MLSFHPMAHTSDSWNESEARGTNRGVRGTNCVIPGMAALRPARGSPPRCAFPFNDDGRRRRIRHLILARSRDMAKLSVDQIDVKGKRVLLRCDFNVPVDKSGQITDDIRIRE